MQQILSKDVLWYKYEELDPIQQETVATFIDSLLAARVTAETNDKDQLLAASVWDADDVQQIKDAQAHINRWQLPEF